MTEQEAIMIIGNNIKTEKVEKALDTAVDALAKIDVIKRILNECYEGWIADHEAIRRIKDLID